MADAGVRKHCAKIIEDGLIRDLARQSHIARRNRADGRTYECAAPMRRRTGKVRDAHAASSRARCSATGSPALDSTNERAAQDGAKENLQATVAADVIEGAPYYGLFAKLIAA